MKLMTVHTFTGEVFYAYGIDIVRYRDMHGLTQEAFGERVGRKKGVILNNEAKIIVTDRKLLHHMAMLGIPVYSTKVPFQGILGADITSFRQRCGHMTQSCLAEMLVTSKTSIVRQEAKLVTVDQDFIKELRELNQILASRN